MWGHAYVVRDTALEVEDKADGSLKWGENMVQVGNDPGAAKKKQQIEVQ
jgi:hypothetical protein